MQPRKHSPYLARIRTRTRTRTSAARSGSRGHETGMFGRADLGTSVQLKYRGTGVVRMPGYRSFLSTSLTTWVLFCALYFLRSTPATGPVALLFWAAGP